MSPPVELGRVPGLEVLEELGHGAQTVVYRVRRGGSQYALKVLQGSGRDDDRALVAFRREAAMLACVDHPGLSRIFEVGQVGGRPYLVLDLVDGRALTEAIQAGPMAESQLVRLGIDVAGALAAAHRAGLVHRDVKPDNIMVLPDGRARVIDLGLATRDGAEDENVLAGTPAYAAPEQTGMLKRAVDGRADLYALGVVLFECATGRPPFAASDVGELLRLHATTPAPDPATLRPDLSPATAAIIGKLLAKDPDDRYQSGEGLLADLLRLAGHGEEPFPLGERDEPTGSLTKLPLVGRDREVAELTARWHRARAGHGGVALVTGAPGGGKSRLARELTTAVRAEGELVLHGKCSADDPVPLAPLRVAVEHHLQLVNGLPDAERAAAVERLRAAAGNAASLLRGLSPALAELLAAPELTLQANRHEQFTRAVAVFLVELAKLSGGAVLHIDDVQWLDSATRRVFQHFPGGISDAPLLVVATARDDVDSIDATEAFRGDLGSVLDVQVGVGPLGEEGIAGLVRAQLPGATVSAELITQLARRSGGNPFTALEYMHAVIDAGLLRPSWGSWLLDTEGLAALELSGDVVELVLRRIDGLGPRTRRLLVTAATIGVRFRAELLARVARVEPGEALEAIGDAIGRRLVEPHDAGEYAFLHDRIREALLAELDAVRLRGVHQRIAQVLDAEQASVSGDPERVYAVARHYALGESDRTPERVFMTSWAAGRLALTEHAPFEALAFLGRAAAAVEGAGIVPGAAFHQTLGLGCARAGRFAESLTHLDTALGTEADPLRRAGILALAAQVRLAVWQPDQALATVRRGLAQIGRPLPRTRLLLLASTLLSFLAGLFVGKLNVGFGTASGERAERYRLEATLCELGGHAATLTMRPLLRAILSFRALYPINRLGSSPEYVRHLSGFGMVASLFHRPALADRIFARAAATAARIGDPALVAHVAWKRGAGKLMGSVDDGETWAEALVEHERWMDLGDYLTGVASRCAGLVLRGCTREARALYERGRARLGEGAQTDSTGFMVPGVIIPAQLGLATEAAERLTAARSALASHLDGAANPSNILQHLNVLMASIECALEQGDLGSAFDEPAAEFAGLALKPSALMPEHRAIYVYLAAGRLEQCRLATSEDARRAGLAAAEKALADLRRTANRRLLRAFHDLGAASFELLSGRPETALDRLGRVDLLSRRINVPLLAYEAARVRARALRMLGQGAQAERQARYASLIASEQGWVYRARWIRSEFGAHDTPHWVSHAAGSGGGNALHRRRLEALQQVGLAAASVVDPGRLARVALDETVRILGAERAFLFLLDVRDGAEVLVPHLGRDASGTDVAELTGYSSTLVERVREAREAVVVTGSEEGAALGSRSALVHGLRSIMIAPLLLDGRLLGVVYLDSRVAKGIFTADDVDILVAITNHVAVSLETARAAQLEVAVAAARQQRDIAETLRAAMTELSTTLDPDTVIAQLLAVVTHTLPADAACLLRRDGAEAVVVAALGAGAGPAAATAGRRLDIGDSAVSALLDATTPLVGAAPGGGDGREMALGGLLGHVGRWLAIPLATRGQAAGVLVVASKQPGPFADAQVEIAAALAGQGVIAYDNARLFTQVQRLATIDELTGLSNRRQFFDLARQQLRVAQRRRREVGGIMIDIDQFKRINDTHGHAVGDEVIRTVAARLREVARTSDVLGRLGGEEFAVLTPEDGAQAASAGERLRRAIAAQPILTQAGPLDVTISVGVAHLAVVDEDLDDLLARADAALYRAKQHGRNRVVTEPASQ